MIVSQEYIRHQKYNHIHKQAQTKVVMERQEEGKTIKMGIAGISNYKCNWECTHK